MPVNENDEFPRFLESGVYEKVSPSRACLSNAMNVGNPSNLARFFDLYGGTVDRQGKVYVKPNLAEMRKQIFSVSVSDTVTKDTIKDAYEKYGVLLEPHGAVSWKGLEVYLEKEGRLPSARSLGRHTRPSSPMRSSSSRRHPRAPARNERHRQA